jgi:hypothetical protein
MARKRQKALAVEIGGPIDEFEVLLAKSNTSGDNDVDTVRFWTLPLSGNTGEKTIELYGLWWGNFAKDPLTYEDIPFHRILEPAFLFREQVSYRVAAKSVPTLEVTGTHRIRT